MKNIIYKEFPIETEHLYLNKIETYELIYIRNKLKASEEYKMTCRPIKKRNDSELKDFYENILNGSSVIFSIRRKFDNELLGKISFSDYNKRNKSMEMGYYLIDDFRGNGYMREAISNILEILFNKIMLNKVYAQTGSFNESSIKTL
ncbi:MAG: GNAT family N-acetyltransferase, partial [Clostridium sp.]